MYLFVVWCGGQEAVVAALAANAILVAITPAITAALIVFANFVIFVPPKM